MGAVNGLALKARPHLRNAGWSLAEYLFYPLLMLAATPVLVGILGTAQYGLLMLVNSIAGLGGIATLGMGAATIKYVSERLGRQDRAGAAAAIRATLLLAALGGALLAAALVGSSPWLASTVFLRMGEHHDTVHALVLAGIILLLMQIDGVFASALRGMEQFRAAARLEIIFKSAIVCVSILTAWITRSAGAVLLTTAALTLGSALTKGTIAGRLIGAGVIIPRLGDRQTMREVLSFGLWNWLTGIGGLVFVHADRLLIGSWLGATPLSYYTVCTQLAQQIHALPAAAMSFLFPLISRKSQTSGREALRALRVYAVAFNVLISSVLAALLYVFAVPILTAWMGRTFAAEAGYVLHWLVIGFYLVSLNIAPHFLLLGGNGVRYVSITNVIGGLAGLAAAFVLLPVSGLLGAAQARLIMGTTTLANYWKLFNEPDAKP